jgi:hypothetical protein
MGNDDFSGSYNKQIWICALTHYLYNTADKEKNTKFDILSHWVLWCRTIKYTSSEIYHILKH